MTCEGRNDAKEFANIRSAMRVLNFSDNEILDILMILAALIHIGNIQHRGKFFCWLSSNCHSFVICNLKCGTAFQEHTKL